MPWNGPPADRKSRRRWRTGCGTGVPDELTRRGAILMVSDFPAPGSMPVLPATIWADTIHGHGHDCRVRGGPPAVTPGWRLPPIRPGGAVRGRRAVLVSGVHGSSRRSTPCRRGNRVLQGAALAGLVATKALPFMEYREALNCRIRRTPEGSPPLRAARSRRSRAYAVCYALAGAVITTQHAPRWEAAMIALRRRVPEERRTSRPLRHVRCATRNPSEA